MRTKKVRTGTFGGQGKKKRRPEKVKKQTWEKRRYLDEIGKDGKENGSKTGAKNRGFGHRKVLLNFGFLLGGDGGGGVEQEKLRERFLKRVNGVQKHRVSRDFMEDRRGPPPVKKKL